MKCGGQIKTMSMGGNASLPAKPPNIEKSIDFPIRDKAVKKPDKKKNMEMQNE
jgi:hypothetical protein